MDFNGFPSSETCMEVQTHEKAPCLVDNIHYYIGKCLLSGCAEPIVPSAPLLQLCFPKTSAQASTGCSFQEET